MTGKQHLEIQDRLCKETTYSVFEDITSLHLLYEYFYEENGIWHKTYTADFHELLGQLEWYIYYGQDVYVDETCCHYSSLELRCVKEWIKYLKSL